MCIVLFFMLKKKKSLDGNVAIDAARGIFHIWGYKLTADEMQKGTIFHFKKACSLKNYSVYGRNYQNVTIRRVFPGYHTKSCIFKTHAQ